MTTIADKLNQIIQLKQQLNQLLDSEGVTTNGTFEDIINKVDSLQVQDSLSFTEFMEGDISEFTSYVDVIVNSSLCGLKSTKMYFPELITASTLAFSQCINLDYIYAPKLESLGMNGCAGCVSLGKYTKVGFPNLKTVGSYAFQNCTSLGIKGVSFPCLTTLDKYSFANCTSLKAFEFTNIKTIPIYCFNGCSSLTKVWIPKTCTTIDVTSASGSNSIYVAPFYGCSSNLVIYTDAKSQQSGWQANFNVVGINVFATVKYNSTYQTYLNA
jgi:hypothetical protein